MSRFLQLHLLTFYPPANLNRDDSGRPKSAVVGGVPRLRISSQSLKRAWRTSPVFAAALEGHLAQRTQRLGEEILKHLLGLGIVEEKAQAAARSVAGLFGKIKPETDENPTRIEQLAFISPAEHAAAIVAAERIAAGEDAPKAESLLGRIDTAADLAMFGRMLADTPDFNREAAVQVAHAVTTHKAVIEDDFYTAVDDLKKPAEDAGAGFIGEQGFGSGVFYLYICVDLGLLAENLGGDKVLAGTAVAALAEAAATIAPNGKQASFASRARAHYMLAERGDQQPRTLAVAFVPAVNGSDPVKDSVERLNDWRRKLEAAYGAGAEDIAEMDVVKGKGSLAAVIAFCRAAAAGGSVG
jgi:CRISPR system Cascade subunit CasC